MLPPVRVSNEDQTLVAITNEGRMLIFPLADLPKLARGKGNKIINIASARAAEGLETVTYLQLLSADDSLVLHAGRRHVTLKPSDLEHYRGERGRRGNKLPRGLQKVDQLDVVSPEK